MSVVLRSQGDKQFMTENPSIEERLKQYPCTEDSKENLKLAKQIITEYYSDAPNYIS